MSTKTVLLFYAPCPLIHNPHKDCHCVDMNSQKVFSALDYCASDYEKCDIYQRHLQEEYLKFMQDRNNGAVRSKEDDNVQELENRP
jgi:hypothetical protein